MTDETDDKFTKVFGHFSQSHSIRHMTGEKCPICDLTLDGILADLPIYYRELIVERLKQLLSNEYERGYHEREELMDEG